jgi:hypothetical protein
MPQIGQHQRQLLLVIGAAVGFPWVLDQDDSQFTGILARQRANSVRELVVGNEEPAATRRIGLALFQQASESTGVPTTLSLLVNRHLDKRPSRR